MGTPKPRSSGGRAFTPCRATAGRLVLSLLVVAALAAAAAVARHTMLYVRFRGRDMDDVHVPMSGAAARRLDLTPVTRLVYDKPTAVVLLGRDGSPLALPRPPPLPSAGGGRLYAIFGSQDGWRGYVSEEYFHLFRALEHAYGWRVADARGGDGTWAGLATTLAAQLGRVPDVLLFMEDFRALQLRGERGATPLAATSLWLFMDDLHNNGDEIFALRKAGIAAADLVLASYSYAFDGFYPGAAATAHVWVPHAASSLFQLPLRPAADVARTVLLSGSTEAKWYPHRARVEAMMRAGDTRFVQHRHPGYAGGYGGAGVGADYAARLNGHLACITDGLTLNYTVGKVFEIPATGCLLLANAELGPVLAALGFSPGVHYVPYTAASLDAVVDAVLAPGNADAVDAIRAQGQRLVWARHTVSHRAAAIHELAGQQVPGHRWPVGAPPAVVARDVAAAATAAAAAAAAAG